MGDTWRGLLSSLTHTSFWFSWTSVSICLDILLMWFLVYRVLLLVRGTRAQPMLTGLGIVVLLYVLSRSLGLVAVNWLLGNFLGSAILVIVVLFREDLSRALVKVGLTPGLGSQVPQALETSVTEISHAAAELGAKKVGALIVVKRDVGLEEFTEQAVAIGAQISRQLLISLFNPASPLHDGAVIVEGDRIVVAGAVLPLTFNPLISTNYGTRHRAAIGLSERTDAVIIVVSEETGTISLVREGRITRDLNERSLYNALHRLTLFRHHRRRRQLLSRLARLGREEVKEERPLPPEPPTIAGDNRAESINN